MRKLEDLITLEVAKQLFSEAHDYYSGRIMYISEASQIRTMAEGCFGKSDVQHLQRVCDEIFYALACELQKVPR